MSSYSLDFDGSNDIVTVANIGTLSSVTVEFWMYNTDSGNGGRYAQMVSRGANGSGWDWSVYLQSLSVANTLRWVGPGGTTIDTNVIPLNTWTHIAVTCNNVQTKIYINGALIRTQSTTNAMTNQTSSVMFGNDVSMSRPYRGRLSEIRIWNIIRSDSDISTYYNTTLVGNETGLIGYYKLNSTSGSTAVDTSSSARNGTLSNFLLSGATSNWVVGGPPLGITPTIGALAVIPTKTFGTDVSFNLTDPSSNSSGAFTYSSSNTSVATLNSTNALSFDGVNDGVALTSYPSLNSTNQLTIEGWIYTTGYSNMIVTINSTAALEINAQGRISLYATTVGTGGNYLIVSDSAITLNAWVYIAVVKNDNGYNKLYVNNALVKNTADTTSGVFVAATGLSLGANVQASIYSSIRMSEFRMWTVARTAQQLTDTYNIQIPSNSSGLAIYYKFNQGTPNGTNTGLTTLTDSTSNNYHGTLQGFALSGTTSNWVTGPSLPTVCTIVGAGTSTITATQAADASYISGSVSTTLTVNAALPIFGTTFTLGPKSGLYVLADASFSLTAPTSDSSGAFSYTSDNSAVAVISSGHTISNLLARYDASVASGYTLSGSNVTQWNDLTGNGYHLTPNGTGPTLTTIKSVPAFNFNSGYGLIRASVPLSTSITVFIVARYSTNIAGYGSFMHHGHRDTDWAIERDSGTSNVHFQSGNSGNAILSAANDTNYIWIGRVVGNTREFWRYSDTVSTGFISGTPVSITPGNKTLYVGKSDNNEASNGSIGEILYYNASLSNADVSANLLYLQNKWFNGLTASSGVTLVGYGTANITATQDACGNYLTKSVSSLLTVSDLTTPTLGTFTVPSTKVYGDASFNISLRPTSDSSGAITYTSSNTGVATIDASGNWITLVGAGDVSFNALQAAVPNQFSSATNTSNTLTVSIGTPTLSASTFSVDSSKAYGDASFAIVTRPTSNSTGAITYTSSNTGVATIDASGNWITLVGAGDVSFNALQAAVPNQFSSATNTSNTLTVSKATISLAFVNPPTTKNVTDAAFTVTASGARPDSVTYSSSDIALATVNSSSGLVTLKGVGTVIITASQASTEFYNTSTAICSIVIASAGTTLQGQTVSSSTTFALVDLSGASLVGTTVSGVSFSSANLSNVNFSGAVITGTNFSNANISGATNLPAFSTVQKLQLLKNINNAGIGAIQVNAPISGADINSLLATPNNQVAAATFTVKAPTQVDASANKIVSISSEDIAGNKSIYIPINENETVKVNNIVYSFNGTNLLDASGNVVTFLITQNTPFKIYAGSIVALNIQTTLNRITILGDGLYNILHEILQPKTV